ncbi:hypothetical protein [Halorarum salinum]|uniref:Uncharacterized protein n=1 Tax=Halorarum salinum TaxID=2743089 RepID=A0A7D5LB33_9EURY|nr:hypothetical protein [Halobaculum salinum]QLG61835.1 hypothetical protein HUG12_08895 [Halobaculum salinum]
MVPSSFAVAHVGPGSELTALGYVFLVLLHLLAFGGVALLLSWLLGVLGAGRTGT